MIKLLHSYPQLAGRTLQWWMTWALLASITTLIVSRLLEQSPDIVVGVLAIACLLLGGGLLVWQQVQLRQLKIRLYLLEQQVHKPGHRAKHTPAAPAAVSHIDSDQLFRQGQTKH